MTNEQFFAIQKLIRGKPEAPGTQAARLVLVQGMSYSEAAAATGAMRNGVWNAVKRYEDAFELIKTHFTQGPAPTTGD